jgi:hypothetical protein
MSTRLNVNVNDETAAAIRALGERNGRTATETIRRAVGAYDFLLRRQRQGAEIQTVDLDGNKTAVVIL